MNIKKDFTVEVLYDTIPIGAIIPICSNSYRVLKQQTGDQVVISIGIVHRNTGLKFVFIDGTLKDITINSKGKKGITISDTEKLKVASYVPICDFIDFFRFKNQMTYSLESLLQRHSQYMQSFPAFQEILDNSEIQYFKESENKLAIYINYENFYVRFNINYLAENSNVLYIKDLQKRLSERIVHGQSIRKYLGLPLEEFLQSWRSSKEFLNFFDSRSS
jgi:hypothetical protein